MKKRMSLGRMSLGLATIGALILGLATSAQAGAIVVGKDSPIGTLDADTAKNVFLGRKPILDGQTVVVLFQKDGSAVRTDFEDKIVGKTGAELASYMAKQIFTGKAAAPAIVDGDAAVRSKVGSSPNAIGYVSDGGVDSTVKVILKF
jgi:ABC-type phosphate transport system substrate-binding protein